jgi:hypothetical protein
MNTLVHLSVLSVAVPLTIALLRYRKLAVDQRRLIPFLVVALITDCTTTYLIKGESNLPLLHLYTVLEFGLLLEVFRGYFNSKKINSLSVVLIILFVGFSIYFAFFMGGLPGLNSYPRGIECFILLGFSLYFYFNLLQNLQVEKVYSFPMFWITTAILVYFAGNLFLFVAGNDLLNVSKEITREFYKIHSVLNILKNLLFAYGLWLSHRT